jgi:phosphinothricin acetyltransferase
MHAIRHARPEDASALAAIWNPLIRDTAATFTSVEKTAAGLAEAIAARAAGLPWLVAVTSAGPAGFATCAPFRPGPGYARTLEHTIILAPAATRRGLGARLMDRLAAEAAAAGGHALIGAISAENGPALAFHAAQGFAEVGRIPEAGRKFGRWIDLVLVRRPLAGPHQRADRPAA